MSFIACLTEIVHHSSTFTFVIEYLKRLLTFSSSKSDIVSLGKSFRGDQIASLFHITFSLKKENLPV